MTLAYASDDASTFTTKIIWTFKRAQCPVSTFSPLKDKELPVADAYYFGGGFPEVYAQELMANDDFRASVKKAHEQGRPIYAECGGLMYLGELLEVEGQVYEMVGIFKGKSLMTLAEKLGYCQAETQVNSLLVLKVQRSGDMSFTIPVFGDGGRYGPQAEKVRDGQVVAAWTGRLSKGPNLLPATCMFILSG